MRLTTYTDYSLRVLIYLGVRKEELVTIKQISDHYGISNNHLLKVVHQLGLMGFVETVRGRNGGLRLARPAAQIVIGDVVRKMEQDMALVQCFDGEAAAGCRIVPACVLKGALGRALQAFLGVLDQYTLAQLVEPRERLAELLQLDRAAGAVPDQVG
ncbi:Rrf2 family transcriptional regulator [Skermanella sp. TT6]|uniref:Rrf2 family transcriptional regulator n=1 Tax=Skermanella cutis TaxID=2775420 RepID=A0ABX7B9S4_9PROT|nr:Rrf2 family transcriptional regulator [Skermanella sp. TT6]QQP91124.1 Rrf2 family transcriptional regulator [Skermanella sp. TT6]